MKKNVTLVVLAALMMLALVACGSPAAKTDSPTDVINTFAEKWRALDFEGVNACLVNDGDESTDFANMSEEDQQTLDMFKPFFESLKIDVISVNEATDGNSAVADVKVTTINVSKGLEDMITDIMSKAMTGELTEDNIEEYTMNALSDMFANTAETTESTGIINLTKVDGQWKIEGDDDLAKVVMGSLTEMLNSLGM